MKSPESRREAGADQGSPHRGRSSRRGSKSKLRVILAEFAHVGVSGETLERLCGHRAALRAVQEGQGCPGGSGVPWMGAWAQGRSVAQTASHTLPQAVRSSPNRWEKGRHKLEHLRKLQWEQQLLVSTDLGGGLLVPSSV